MKNKIIAISNQKGGVGKTTTAINLSTALAAIGEKVLIIDLDPQGNASTGLGIDYQNRSNSIYEVLASQSNLFDAIQNTEIENLKIIPSTVDLSGIEPELAEVNDRAFTLKKILTDQNSLNDFSFVFIDCPPALSLLTVMAMTAADSIIVPLQCEFFALEGSVSKNAKVKVKRNEKIVFDGDILSLKREKNETNEVKSGTECGISIKEFSDFEVGDFIEAFNIEEIAQTL